MKKTISVLIISDKRAGHLNRSLGVVLALRKRVDVDLQVLEIGHNKVIPSAFLPKFARLLPAKFFLRFVHGLNFRNIAKPDIIISAGGRTIGANAALAEIWGVPNIYTGKLRGMPKGSIRLSFPPYCMNGELKPRRILWPPVNLNPADFTVPKPFVGKENSLGVLIGGDTAPVPFNAEAWERIADLLIATAAHVKYIKIATSPRTPNDAYAAFSELKKVENIDLIDYRKAGLGSAKAVFECDAICATLDSTSMMTEALAARRPVVALRPNKIQATPDIRDLDEQISKGRMAELDIENECAAELLAKLKKLHPLSENHLEVLANAIFADLPELL